MEPDSKRVDYLWDVFLSHSANDKTPLAIPLANGLKEAGLRTWLDSMAIHPGDSLRKEVNEAISWSRFGVVILSPDFLEKKWTLDELEALLALEERDQPAVIPILHGLSSNSLARRFPLLANRAHLTSAEGVDALVAAIVKLVVKAEQEDESPVLPTIRRRLLNLLADDGTSPDIIRRFLAHHEDTVYRALCTNCDPSIVWTPNFGGFRPDICVSNLLPTSGLREWHVIVLGPLSSDLFSASAKPRPEINRAVTNLVDLRNWLVQNHHEASQVVPGINPDFAGVIVAGRRAGLSEAQGEHIRNYITMCFSEFVCDHTTGWFPHRI